MGWRRHAASEQQGLMVLGTPLGSTAYVQAALRSKREVHDALLDKITGVPDLQSAFRGPLRGWQRSAAASLDTMALESFFRDLDPASRALLVSQAGSGGPRTIMRAAARMCREAGARVATNVFLRDMTVGLPLADSRRIDVLANGLPLWRGAQVAVDTTLVCPLTCSGEPRPGAERKPGLALQTAANRQRRPVYPELVVARRCKLVVLGVEVGGRIGQEALGLSAS